MKFKERGLKIFASVFLVMTLILSTTSLLAAEKITLQFWVVSRNGLGDK